MPRKPATDLPEDLDHATVLFLDRLAVDMADAGVPATPANIGAEMRRRLKRDQEIADCILAKDARGQLLRDALAAAVRKATHE